MNAGPRLEGRVAIVTGGARGIGAAISRNLVSGGAAVVIADSGVDIAGNDADPAVAAALAADLGERATAHAEDMAHPAAAAAAVELAVERFGGLDIVVNNAAILRDAFIFKGSAADWEAVIRNNLSGPYHLLAAATPLMREQSRAGRGAGRWGRIVNIVSTAGVVGNYGQAPYAAAKGGLLALTRIAALDMARSGVTSNAVAPFARTRVTETIVPANEEQERYKARAMKVPADHVADFVGWLCSEDAGDVTGQLFGVRGRELMLFSQAEAARTTVCAESRWSHEGLTETVNARFRGHFASLATDLEQFNVEPAI